MASSESVDMKYVYKCSEHLLKENLKMLDMIEEKRGVGTVRAIVLNFLCSFIGNLVYRTLIEQPANLHDKSDRYDYAEQNFKDIKLEICESVSVGFTAGVKHFSGKNVDYFCKLSVIGDPVNREPC